VQAQIARHPSQEIFGSLADMTFLPILVLARVHNISVDELLVLVQNNRTPTF